MSSHSLQQPLHRTPSNQAPSTTESVTIPSALSDEELIKQLIDGNDYAWIEFHNRYSRLICRCITKVMGRFCSVSSGEDIREIYANLTLQLLSNNMHKLRTYDPDRGTKLGTWIGMLSINASYDYLRSIRREPNCATLTEAERIPSDRHDPFAEMDRKERDQILNDMLRGFSAKDRLFVALYFDQGLDAEVVAQRMNISVKTVYSKKHKIRTRLERLLQRESIAA